jgi:mRNA interferase MazF
MTSRDASPLRGQVFFADLPNIGEKPVVVVSNNVRNRALRDVLVARITTASRPDIASVVPIPDGEPVVGRVLCDDVSQLPKSSFMRLAGGLSRPTMRAVDEGLRVALGLT